MDQGVTNFVKRYGNKCDMDFLIDLILVDRSRANLEILANCFAAVRSARNDDTCGPN